MHYSTVVSQKYCTKKHCNKLCLMFYVQFMQVFLKMEKMASFAMVVAPPGDAGLILGYIIIPRSVFFL